MSTRSFERAATMRRLTTEGQKTTEYEAAKSGAAWSIAAFVLGIVGTFGSTIAEAFGVNSTAGVIVGVIVTVAGLVSKVLIELGYIKARASVKIAAADAVSADATAEAYEPISSVPEQQLPDADQISGSQVL